MRNGGQTDPAARYYVQGADTSFFFSDRGLALSVKDRRTDSRRWGLRLDFVGARKGVMPVGRERTPTVVSHFRGARANQSTRSATYSKVAYRDLWPGIDLVYSLSRGRLKYSFVVAPGADPERIRLAWRGAKGLKLTRRGQLGVSTPAGDLRDDAPRSFQGGEAVSSSYHLGAGHTYGFRIGAYDRTRPLVIDPMVLGYAGYLGGSLDEQANGSSVDAAGNLYTAGTTSSADFPTKVGPDSSFNGGADDAFVAKVNPSGTGLVWVGYIGGSDTESGIAAVPDAAGNVFVSGFTSSSEQEGFPATGGSFDSTYNGDPRDGFVAKVRADGSGLLWAGYVGGAGPDQALGGSPTPDGGFWIGGFTNSTETSFPDGDGFGSVPGFDQTQNGIADVFVAKVNPGGSGLDYATFVGGGGVDVGGGASVDGAGNL